MRLNNSFFYTLREESRAEESVSGNLLTRAGMIKKTSNGKYIYIPLDVFLIIPALVSKLPETDSSALDSSLKV